MSLANELSSFYDDFHSNIAPPEISATIKSATKDHKASFDTSKAIQAGDKLPPFRLKDAKGKEVTSSDLLAQGPVLISFYRGEWCPFCNMALRSLQQHLPAFQAKGVQLVAISPELPDTSLSTTEKHGLEFTVLSDVGNGLARQLGIVFEQPESMRKIFDANGIQWTQRYGDDKLEVPVPATLLVDGKGVVRNTFVEANYHERLEPSTALKWVDAL
jgi:peroxiredoxin